MDSMGTGGVLIPMDSEDGRHEGKQKRMFLVGGPFGPVFPLGMFPADGYEEEEDPNP